MSRDRDDIDIGIDARLRRALANAPDAQVEPPAALDEAILHAAHAAARPMPAAMRSAMPATGEPPGFFASLKRWWSHPAAAPAFGVLALSTVIVSLWSHRVPSPTIAEDESPVAATPMRDLAKVVPASPVARAAESAAPSPVPTSTPAGAAPTAPTSINAALATQPADAGLAESKARENAMVVSQAARTSPDRAQTRREGADLQARADKKSDAPPPKEALRRARQEAAAGQRDVDRDERIAASNAARDAAAKAAPASVLAASTEPGSPTPQPSTLPRAQPPTSTLSNEEGRTTASAPVSPPAPEQGGVSASASTSAPAAAKAPTVGSVTSTLSSRAAAATSRDASLDARMAAAADAPPFARAFDAAATWQWRADPTQPLAPIDDRARAWLARLMVASQGSWVRADDEAQAQRPPDARTFELWREQKSWATIVIGPSDATWLEASGRRWRTALPADVLAALRSW